MRNVEKDIKKALERGDFENIEQCEIRETEQLTNRAYSHIKRDEIKEIMRITRNEGLPTPFEYASNGFLFGFECGYRAAKKERLQI